MHRLKWGLAAAPFAVIAACVGDSTPIVTDGGNDATTNDVITADVVDAATEAEAAPPACNLAKPFANKTPLASGAMNINIPGDTQTSFYPRPDELFGLVAREVPDSGQGFDIYSVDRPTKAAVYGNSTRVDVLESDAGWDDFNPVITTDTTEVFFARSGNPNFAGMWTAVMSDAGIGAPSKIAGVVNNSLDRVEPTWISPDSTHLYLNGANIEGGLQYDLYFAMRTGPGQTFTQVKMMNALSSPQNDKAAVLTGDSLTIFFASDRPNGQGGYDVYTATRTDASSPFGTPTAVTELNTPQNEWPVWLTPDGCRMFLTDGTQLYSMSHP